MTETLFLPWLYFHRGASSQLRAIDRREEKRRKAMEEKSRCLKCGLPLEKHWRFCEACGTEVPWAKFVRENHRFCNKCGMGVLVHWRFCETCGFTPTGGGTMTRFLRYF